MAWFTNFRLYREEDYHRLSNFTPPEIQRSSLAPVVLQLKALGIKNVVNFHFPSAPPARNLAVAMELLYALQGSYDFYSLFNESTDCYIYTKLGHFKP